jgi:hypothetical protein
VQRGSRSKIVVIKRSSRLALRVPLVRDDAGGAGRAARGALVVLAAALRPHRVGARVEHRERCRGAVGWRAQGEREEGVERDGAHINLGVCSERRLGGSARHCKTQTGLQLPIWEVARRPVSVILS